MYEEMIIGNMECVIVIDNNNLEIDNFKNKSTLKKDFDNLDELKLYFLDYIKNNFNKNTKIVYRRNIGGTCRDVTTKLWNDINLN